jgi:hypothetical protein
MSEVSMYIKPREGFVIPDRDRRDYLPAEGREVPSTDYWNRRLRDGDVVIAAPPEPPAPPPAPPEPPAPPPAPAADPEPHAAS